MNALTAALLSSASACKRRIADASCRSGVSSTAAYAGNDTWTGAINNDWETGVTVTVHKTPRVEAARNPDNRRARRSRSLRPPPCQTSRRLAPSPIRATRSMNGRAGRCDYNERGLCSRALNCDVEVRHVRAIRRTGASYDRPAGTDSLSRCAAPIGIAMGRLEPGRRTMAWIFVVRPPRHDVLADFIDGDDRAPTIVVTGDDASDFQRHCCALPDY